MSTLVSNPPKWYNVYHGDDECRVFKQLARGKFEWRTVKSLAKNTKLSEKRVEEIVGKYLPLGVIQQHSSKPEQFRYWENASKKKENVGSISDEDKKKRIKSKVSP